MYRAAETASYDTTIVRQLLSCSFAGGLIRNIAGEQSREMVRCVLRYALLVINRRERERDSLRARQCSGQCSWNKTLDEFADRKCRCYVKYVYTLAKGRAVIPTNFEIVTYKLYIV